MAALTDASPITGKEDANSAYGPRLTGAWQKIVMGAWLLVFLLSALSFTLSIVSNHLWDQVLPNDLPRYFPDITQETIAAKTILRTGVLELGLTQASFASFLTFFRLLGSIPLFVVSMMLVLRFPHRLMALLFATLLAVMGAAGIWEHTLFGWAYGLAPWMSVPGQFLSLLLWLGLILVYAFPDARFTPRWTLGLGVVLVPTAISMAFSLPIFLNTNTWPDPLPLLPDLVFIGAALFSVLYRLAHTLDPLHRTKLAPYVLGVSALMVMHFLLLAWTDAYPMFTGHDILQGTRSTLVFILITEPLWFGLELFFAVAVAISIFRRKLLQP